MPGGSQALKVCKIWWNMLQKRWSLSEKYVYHEMDITLDVYDRIKDVAELIAPKEGITLKMPIFY